MIKAAFKKHKSIFIPFIMAGHPDLSLSNKAITALSDAGADIIELGVPFSDPVADGPVNEKAAQMAIKNGMNLIKMLEQVKDLRKSGCKTPIVLFSYLNPILAFGSYEQFCSAAKSSGIDGLLIVDLIPENGGDFYNIAKKAGIEIVLLVSPTTKPERFPLFLDLNPSFIYYISRMDVTGMKDNVSNTLEKEISTLRPFFPNIKIAVGFGISSLEHTNYISSIADGVIIGSKLVSILEFCDLNLFKNTAKEFAQSIHGV